MDLAQAPPLTNQTHPIFLNSRTALKLPNHTFIAITSSAHSLSAVSLHYLRTPAAPTSSLTLLTPYDRELNRAPHAAAMAITDFFSDLYDSFTSSVMTEVHAEAPEEDDKEEEGDEKKEGGDDAEDKEDEGEGSGEEGGDEGGDAEEEEDEEEEEEDEPVDPKPKLEEGTYTSRLSLTRGSEELVRCEMWRGGAWSGAAKCTA